MTRKKTPDKIKVVGNLRSSVAAPNQVVEVSNSALIKSLLKRGIVQKVAEDQTAASEHTVSGQTSDSVDDSTADQSEGVTEPHSD